MDNIAVDIQLTSRCNLDCYGCWGASRNSGDSDIPLNKFKWLIKNILDETDINTIVYDGGEPLIIKNIDEYLHFAKLNGYTNILSTNATLINKRKVALKHITAIGIPLDGPDVRTNAIFRSPLNSNHFNMAIEAINMIGSEFENIKIKLGTVVTKNNMHLIPKIGELICDNNLKLNTWKLYQFLPNFGQNKHQKNVEHSLAISNSEYFDVVKIARKEYPEINIVSYANPQNYGNILIGPDGSLTTEMDESGVLEPYLGNVFSDPISVTKQSILRIIQNRRKTQLGVRIGKTYL